MTTRHTLVGERVTPTGQQLRKQIKASRTIQGFRMKPGYLYTVVRAISARVNQNYDGWPSSELKQAYHTFIGKPVFVNHENFDPNQARGVVVASRYIENGADKYIEVVQEIDAKRFPLLAHEIKTGGLDSVSMGAEAGFTICSACGNQAYDEPDMCDHVKYHKGEKVAVRNRKTGKVEEKLVYESCHKLSFFELSYVFDPADETAVASKVVMANLDKDKPVDAKPTVEPKGDDDRQLTINDRQKAKVDKGDKSVGDEVETNTGDGSDAEGRGGKKRTAADCPPGAPNCNGWNPSVKAPGAVATEGTVTAPAAVTTAPVVAPKETVASVRARVLARLKTADATDDYLDWAKKVDSGEEIPEKGPKLGLPNKGLGEWADRTRKRTADVPPPENSQLTQRPGTMGSYVKAHDYFDKMGAPTDGVLDYGAGLGHSAQWGHTYEPHPRDGFEPTYVNPEDVPEGAHGRVTNLNVLNVVPPEIRHQIVDGVGRSLAPGGHAIITTRGANEVAQTKSAVPADNGDPGAFIVNPGTPRETYQKGFTPRELHQYVSDRLGPGYSVSPVKIGPAGVHVVRTANLKDIVANKIWNKLAYGEIEAPMAVDTLREEGSDDADDTDDHHEFVKMPGAEDDTQDWQHQVESPDDLKTPNLDQAEQIDREQEEDPNGGGMPPVAPEDDLSKFMTIKIPIPGAQDPTTPQVPQVPMQSFASKVGALQTLAFFERYYGYRVADWRDAIEAGRSLSPEEQADFIRESTLLTLENRTSDSTTSRNTVKGTANMARSTLATRRKTAATTRRYAEGPLTDGGDVSRNDQGEQEEAFIVDTPAPDSTDLPDDDTPNISNTENNLVADEEYAHSLTARMARQKAELERTAREYARVAGRRFQAEGDAGGPTATEVNPELPTESANQLRGDDFDSADPNPGRDTSPGGDGGTSLPVEASLQAFRAFDQWLKQTTKKSAREHSEVNIKRAAKQFADYNGIQVEGMFPALGIALRQARKTEAAKKGNAMRKKAVDLETAAPDERVSVPTPVADTTDAEAQASQFDEKGFGNNAGDDLADPDQSTGQNFAPGEAPKTAKKADGILAIRCAEAMIAAGLEPNTRERKYQLAAQFSNMSRGLIMDRVALAERFAMVRHADRQQFTSKVASGSTRGATQSPIPAGLGQGGSSRPQQRIAANSPDNDALLFG